MTGVIWTGKSFGLISFGLRSFGLVDHLYLIPSAIHHASLKFKSFVSYSGIFLSCSVALHLRQDPPSLSCRSLNDFYNFTTLSKSISVMQASRSWFSFDSFVFFFGLSRVDWWVMATDIWNKKRTWVSASVKCAHC